MRLTEKVKEPLPHYVTKNIQFDLPKIIDKLGQLEDIEEELGIDLITLFKALKNGFYYRGINYGEPEIIYFADTSAEDCSIECYVYDDFCKYGIAWEGFAVAYTEDYGKTWALTKEELE